MLNRILIIDDSEEMEHIIRFCSHTNWPGVIIEMYDPKCDIPESGFNWSRYDLLLLDYDLGLDDVNGMDWLRQFKTRVNMPPIILLTAYGSKELEAEAHKLGVDDYLNKGQITPDLFSERVKKVLQLAEPKQPDDVGGVDEKTQFLSPQEKHHYMSALADSAVQGSEEDIFDKTRLLASEEMASIIHTDNSEDASVAEHKSAETAVTKQAVTPTTPHKRSETQLRTTSSHRRPRSASDISLVVPGYYLEKKIGEGGMASIYLAKQEEDGLKVVLKVLSLGADGESGLLRRFMREYKLIGQIEHPNIIQIYERAFASNFAYISMEYFGYGDLAQRLKTGIDSKTAISYLHQIASGLGAAHAKGIVHRDMKPANILFRSPDELAIADFGIAKDVETENNLQKNLTMDGELMGTLYYISPEQILGTDADQKSDLYSLGIIMYKMLTNRHPYVGNTPADVFDGHLNGPIPVLPDEFVSLQPLLDGLMSKDPDERFQSTDDLLMGLNWKEWT